MLRRQDLRDARPGRGRLGARGLALGLVLLASAGCSGAPAAPSTEVTSATSPSVTSVSAGTPIASAGPTTAASATPSTPAPLAQVPGPGTVDGALAHLRGLGFTCSSEDQPGMASWVCTRYRENPTMMAYVGGASGRRLGRLSLSVQDGDQAPSPVALALQRWVAAQVLPAGQASQLVRSLSSGTDERFATAEVGALHARGSADGTIVAFVDGWVPDEVAPGTLLPGAPLGPALAALGYSCSGSGPVTCTARSAGTGATLVHMDDGMDVTRVSLAVTGTSGLPAAAAARVRDTLGLFQGHDALLGWFARHQHDGAGATGYQDGVLLDWYPGPPDGSGTASFAVREPCWLDTTENC